MRYKATAEFDLEHLLTDIGHWPQQGCSKTCFQASRLPEPQYIFITTSVLQCPPKLSLSKFLSYRQDTLTRNGLRCFPTPVNRLPACEGIDGFDIGCCLTQKRRYGSRDSPFLTLHIHHIRQSNGWDTGLPQGKARKTGERICRGSERKKGWQISPRHGRGKSRPTYHVSHLQHSIFNSLFCHAPSCCDCKTGDRWTVGNPGGALGKSSV